MLFLRESTLMAQPFDLATLSTRGDAVVVAEGVRRFFETITFTVSENGTLVYRPAGAEQTQLIWVNRAGQAETGGAPAGVYEEVSLSADGTRAAYGRSVQGDTDVWLTDLHRHITSRFTFRPPLNNVPIWSPDGRQIVFASARGWGLDLYQRVGRQRPGGRAAQPESPAVPRSVGLVGGRTVSDLLPDGSKDAAGHLDAAAGGRCRHAHARSIPQRRLQRKPGQFSPDGRWIAYVSDESGVDQVYVQSFPPLGAPRQLSTTGGTQPRWRRDGKELFYLASDRKLMAVTLRTGATFDADAPRALFQTALSLGELRQAYAVSGDGQRFLLNTTLDAGPAPITTVLNWPALLKK
jgi:hypothetical protein